METVERVEILLFEPALRDDFKRLNLAWIERYFTVEPHDLEQLNHPEACVESGGMIFFARTEGDIVGTCALIRAKEGEFELAKMAVTPEVQGRGIGKKLGEVAIAWAKENGATRICLESNRRLETAIRLYERLGFREIPLGDTPYQRCDIKMEIDL
jgi:putative acetyltransferase